MEIWRNDGILEEARELEVAKIGGRTSIWVKNKFMHAPYPPLVHSSLAPECGQKQQFSSRANFTGGAGL